MEIIDILILLFAGFIAGFVDSIAGGGGIITLPTLLAVGLPPNVAIATNKFQGSFGTLSSVIYHIKNKTIDFKEMVVPIFFTLIGASAGAILINSIDSNILEMIIPIVLIMVAIYFLFSPKLSEKDSYARVSLITFSITFALIIGFYDGFFGPGTGSFFMIACISLLGSSIKKALAQTKVLNFTSNITSLLIFLVSGTVYIFYGVVMAIGQVAGAWLGSHIAIKKGIKIIKPLILIVAISISIYQLYKI